MAFGDRIAQINGDQTQPSFTGITGLKAEYDDESAEKEE
jgi:hypothetical protein